MISSPSNEEIFSRCLQYFRDGTPGLAIAYGVSFYAQSVSTSFINADKVTFRLNDENHTTVNVSERAIFDHRASKWSSVSIPLHLTEEEFFQRTLIQEIHLTYEEYSVLNDIGNIIRQNMYDDCEWNEL